MKTAQARYVYKRLELAGARIAGGYLVKRLLRHYIFIQTGIQGH
jgi:hypothetical protein